MDTFNIKVPLMEVKLFTINLCTAAETLCQHLRKSGFAVTIDGDEIWCTKFGRSFSGHVSSKAMPKVDELVELMIRFAIARVTITRLLMGDGYEIREVVLHPDQASQTLEAIEWGTEVCKRLIERDPTGGWHAAGVPRSSQPRGFEIRVMRRYPSPLMFDAILEKDHTIDDVIAGIVEAYP